MRIIRVTTVAIALVSAAIAQSQPPSPAPSIAPFRLSDVMAPVPIPTKFADGWAATDPQSGISVRVIQAHTSPRCRAEHNCPWVVEWECKSAAKGDRAEVTVDAGFFGQVVSYVPAHFKDRAKLQRYRVTLDPAEVHFIQIVVWKGEGRKEKEVARAVFR